MDELRTRHHNQSQAGLTGKKKKKDRIVLIPHERKIPKIKIYTMKTSKYKNGSYDMENDNFRAIINERQSAIKVKAMLLKDVLIFS